MMMLQKKAFYNMAYTSLPLSLFMITIFQKYILPSEGLKPSEGFVFLATEKMKVRLDYDDAKKAFPIVVFP